MNKMPIKVGDKLPACDDVFEDMPCALPEPAEPEHPSDTPEPESEPVEPEPQASASLRLQPTLAQPLLESICSLASDGRTALACVSRQWWQAERANAHGAMAAVFSVREILSKICECASSGFEAAAMAGVACPWRRVVPAHPPQVAQTKIVQGWPKLRDLAQTFD